MSKDHKPVKDDHPSSLKLDEESRGCLEKLSAENCDSRAALDDCVECRTPVSEDHKIPPVRSCPPTPRKQAPGPSRKRKLHFFETSRREEVESFFRSSFLELSKAADKRRCTSI
ncbi:cyclin-dependent protein kinase inhibitor SMR1-like [Punica granatum]|uniref:Uncharacterized protein n=2 Tax=Punica granatum TaxID=22663 RepID=A0A218W8R5_PUNGR|nr:cyclin-dependent protein kinase inhibitor SMR1-like [Punica granatum]OWM68943.1 hypothetical protein CDL15_Pgr025130 [Punica granatum]PKI78796.1 hypothetical protein CRG98_000863 [Punica granatum]